MRGLRPILIVVIALYWLAAAADVTRAWLTAAAEVVKPSSAFVALTNGKVLFMQSYDPSRAFTPDVCARSLAEFRDNLSSQYQGLTVSPGACTAGGIDRARSHIRFVEGRKAAGSELLGWSVAFVVLSMIGLVVCRLWPGRFGKPAPRRPVSPS